MTIEQTLDRIAAALEAQATATSSQNSLLADLLERLGNTDEAPAAGTKPARRSRKAGETPASDVAPAAPEALAAETPAPQPDAPIPEAPASAASSSTPATTPLPSLEDIQAFATALASKVTPPKVIELIKKTGCNNISSMNPDQLASFWADVQALDATASSANAFA